MKLTIQLLSTGLIATVLFACNNKITEKSESKFLEGNWTYRSMLNLPIDTPFCHLEFATAVIRFQKITGDSIFGVLDMGEGMTLNLKGKLSTSNGTTLFYIVGDGIPNSGTDKWEYDYKGYVVPKWTNGINQVDACVGSVIRAKPHGAAKAGKTASFYMIRQ
jgi:hypothetical protein